MQGKCPYCEVTVKIMEHFAGVGHDGKGRWGAQSGNCPACGQLVVFLEHGDKITSKPNGETVFTATYWRGLVLPRRASRPKAPTDVPVLIAGDYNEAALVIDDSPKASAALSRRCLQQVLREKAAVKKSDLAAEIQELLDRGTLPSHIAENIDHIRAVGNFAAHPIKSQATGVVEEVEPGEAEFNLDVLDQLFDFYYVQPAAAKRRRDALNVKLAGAGKPPMKKP